ncbi:MAG: GNAT family N-acetyltransferase [Candidatus Bathyarchaeota archaeon]|nr:GNAT family N-acetyltransferase [Candidatus Bathyarchaeota archaeon]
MTQIEINTDKTRLDIDFIQWFLNEQSHWAKNRTRETIEKSIKNSLCFGAYHEDKQVGFARVVSDYATFSWVCDVFSHPDYRGMGIGKKLVQAIRNHEQLQDGLMLLKTKDAHKLYSRYGNFGTPELIERFMQQKK